MYIAFVDESGNTGHKLRDPDQPYHYIGGICVEYEKCLALQNDIEKIAITSLGTSTLPDNFEFKGHWLFSGNEYFDGMSPTQRIEITNALLALLDMHGISTIVSAINKPALADKYLSPFHPHDLANLFFLEMFQEFLDEKNKYGLVVADEEQSRYEKIISDFKKYKKQGTGFSAYKSVEITRIIDNIHFVKSHNSWPLQLADVALFFFNRGRKIRRDKDEKEYTRSNKADLSFYEIVKEKNSKFKLFP